MSEIQPPQIYQSLSAYGLLADLRARVSVMRKGKTPSRDTVWNTFNAVNEDGLTPLQSLIFEQGKILLQEHENHVKQVLEPA